MKKILFIVFVIITGCSTTPGEQQPGPITTDDGMWTLIWHDEFESPGVDEEKWNFETGNGFYSGEEWVPGWGNEELEYYTPRRENAFTQNGLLVIRALKEEFPGTAGGKEKTFSYTSAKLNTRGKMEILYGRLEIRALLPPGKGFWPAVWMLPVEEQYGPWAASGEIDIMEAWGSNQSRVAGTIHYGGAWPGNKFSGQEYTFSSTDAGLFHEYALEWEPGELRWYVDGELYQTRNRWYTAPRGTYPAPFNQKFYLILNLAVGGHFDGNPDENTPFPGQMLVDYVRVYELTGREYRFPEPPSLEIPPEERPGDFRPARDDGNEIYNSAFNQSEDQAPSITGVPGSAYWEFLQLPEFGGNARIYLEEEAGTTAARIDILAPGNQPYSVQLIQRLPLVKGHKYRARFQARGSAPRKIQFKINGDEDNAWVVYSQVVSPELIQEYRDFEYTFLMEETSDPAARLEFNAGLSKTSVWIREVSLVDITE